MAARDSRRPLRDFFEDEGGAKGTFEEDEEEGPLEGEPKFSEELSSRTKGQVV